MNKTSENNVINLADHLRSKTPLPAMDPTELDAFALEKEKILLRRVFAFAVDFFSICAANIMVKVSYGVFVSEYLQPLSPAQKTALLKSNHILEAGVFLTIFFAYFFYCNYVLNGKTLGSSLMKLNVIDDNYPFDFEQEIHHPDLAQTAKRALGYMLCYVSFGTFFFLSLLNDEKKGVPDFLSGTRVVSDEWLKSFKAHKTYEREQVRININSLERCQEKVAA